ncbi:hypothetical protein FSP39_005856 [Pinctada imbricata]|uniref:Uncharacterized protein n=1 Tax=Pinctada imbricata TaxID=66713 RepID=A0AA89BQJ4_PINIB|nr:hypothetical protein FSP39_005856 [Pinctada imbricata]
MVISLGFFGLGFISFLLGYCTPFWLETDDRFLYRSGFQKLGLWTACFENWSYFKDYLGKQYNGCYWIFSYDLMPIWKWLNPTWLLSVQVMMTLSFCLQVVTIAVLSWYIYKGWREHIGLFGITILALIPGLTMAICITMFATYSVVDRQWIENPSKTYLSWSFAFTIVAGFLVVFGTMVLATASIESRRQFLKYGPYETTDSEIAPETNEKLSPKKRIPKWIRYFIEPPKRRRETYETNDHEFD